MSNKELWIFIAGSLLGAASIAMTEALSPNATRWTVDGATVFLVSSILIGAAVSIACGSGGRS